MKAELNNVKALIFDYGGTLDTRGRHWAHVLWEAFTKNNVPVTEEQFREAYVHAERTLGKNPIIQPDDDFRALLQKKVNIEIQRLVELNYWTPTEEERIAKTTAIAQYCYDYARTTVQESKATLCQLREVYPMVLVSNFYGNIETILTDFGIRHLFDHIIESAVVGIRKPNPGIFMLGVKATGKKTDETVVIGDSYDKDIEPARSIGCRTVWLKGEGWTKEENTDTQAADCIIEQLSDLLRTLREA